MMKRAISKYTLMICLAFLATAAVLGQNTTPLGEDAILDQLSNEQFLLLNNVSDGSVSQTVIDQSGSDNSAVVDQLNYDRNSLSQAVVIQRGNDNEANLMQDGSGNLSAVTQSGNRNSYELKLDGEDIRTVVEQNGNNNSINQDLSGSNLEYILIQKGSNNEIRQTENSNQTQAPAYQIEQRGSGMVIEISQGSILD